MDCDDSDDQSQNFHLVADNSTKVSSVLCPYALPKFDFDENLHGHLTFDSLVGNGVFLGVPNQEDNPWIEELSRGSSGIEFSPSAAESCSVTRRNNVWSEAASSESVEMLLRSVVQEQQNLPVDTVLEESDAGNDLANITSQMEPNLKEDNNLDHVKDSIASVQPNEFPRSNDTTEANAIQIAVQTQMVENYTYENVESRENVQSVKITTEDCIQVELSSNDSNKAEVYTLEDETFVNQRKAKSSALGVQSEECSFDTIMVGHPSERDKFSEVHLEPTSGLPGNFCKGMVDDAIVNQSIAMDDAKSRPMVYQADIPAASRDCSSNVTLDESVAKARVESTISILGESSSLVGSLDHDLSCAELCKIDVPFTESPKVRESGIVASPKATKNQHLNDDRSMLQEETSAALNSACASDVRVANAKEVEGVETCSNLEPEKCLALKIVDGQNPVAQEHNTLGSVISPDQKPSFSDQKPSFVSPERLSEPFGPQIVSNIAQKSDCGAMMDGTIPAVISEEGHADEGLEHGNEGIETDGVVLDSGHHASSPSQVEHTQIYREIFPSELPVNKCYSDKTASTHEKGIAMPYVIGSSSTFEEHINDVKTICAPKLETSLQIKQDAGDVGQYCSTDDKIRGGSHDMLMKRGNQDKTATIGEHNEANNDGQHLPKPGETGSIAEPVVPLASDAADNCTLNLQAEKNNQDFGDGAVAERIPPSQVTDDVGGKAQSTCMNSGLVASCKDKEDSNVKITPKIDEALPLVSAGAKADSKAVLEIPLVPDQLTPFRGTTQAGSECKKKHGSGKEGRKSTKGNQLKEAPVKFTERMDKSLVNRESSDTKISGIVSAPTSTLPDLNTSVPSGLLQRHFTDSQQVQLRAQIFVYGSLIQGAVPDEACMLSAFGTTDGGRNIWEPAWRACVQKICGHKSHAIGPETPVQSCSGEKATHQSIKQGFHKSKVLSSPAAQSSSKCSPTPAVIPQLRLSSPPWNKSTPCDRPLTSVVSGAVIDYKSFSSLNPWQIPPGQNIPGHAALSPPVSLPFPGVASLQTSALDVCVRGPVLPITEPVKLTPIKGSPSASSCRKHIPANSIASSLLSGTPDGNTSMIENKRPPASPADLKHRKRRKPYVSDGRGPITSLPIAPAELVSPSGLVSSVATCQSQPLSAPVVSSICSTLVSVTASPSSLSRERSDLVDASSFLVDHSKRVDINAAKITLTPDDIKQVEVAKLQAEEASAHAAAALGHCQGIWAELDKQKNSSLRPEIEAKLVSAAVAIAAAASVAKAAAAAAKVASDAAAQVKQMVGEAMVSSKSFSIENISLSLTNYVSNSLSATPSIVMDEVENYGSIEATPTAPEHPKNSLGLVKAAELAAEAVLHVGKVVMMDPQPLSELVKSGPDGYWRVSEPMPVMGVKSKDANGEKSDVDMVELGSDDFAKQSECPSVITSHALKISSPLHPRGTSDNMDGSVRAGGISSSIVCAENDLNSNKGFETLELRKTFEVSTGPEIDGGPISLNQDDYGNMVASTKDNIKEGCRVEVLRDSGNHKAWFTANVLSLKDENVYIAYTDLQSDAGSGQLKEWIPLSFDGNDEPIIRTNHPMAAAHIEGARKRRRTAVKDYVWSVGDRVDAWIHNCWREGIVVEKNKKDETILSVNFPAQGDTAVVRAWNLRPTLIWKDRVWVEWHTSRDESAFKHDTPKTKRMKLGNPAGETSVMTNISKEDIDVPRSRENSEESLLPLSDNEKLYNGGKNCYEDKPNKPRTTRSGVQKEGSKVVFGVPKPGKTQKFIEVSKQYVSEWGRKNNDSVDNFAKYVMPQGSEARRKDNNDSKTSAEEKEVPEFKSRSLKSRKPPLSSCRTSKDTSLTPITEEAGEERAQNYSETLCAESVKESKTSSSKPVMVKGNNAPSSSKEPKVEIDKSIPEASGPPRRSNRMIHPTSRLLESLQSSILVPKFPALSHNKGHRSHHRDTPKG
ncbi:unnamed protein product [Cuscuta campestris]|uniref:Agenet domain-containing protein n=1 Tax=Cuscuta campestris TaxID=132261 RepID=A0A484KD27_9ASTE|nr:unnamed protein product [Cuscuta campestris]